MSLFVAEALDLSRLPAFSLTTVDYEAEFTALRDGIQARFAARGIDYDAGGLETDPYVVLAQEFAYRKTLASQALNDAGKYLTVSYGYGASLDHLAATYFADLGVRRFALVDDPRAFATNPEDWESDADFKRRILLAPEARTAGTLGWYEFCAHAAAPGQFADVVALNRASGLVREGQILLVCLGKTGADETAAISKVRTYFLGRFSHPDTSSLAVRPAVRVIDRIHATLQMRRGPDPAIVMVQARKQLDAYLDERRKIGKPMPVNGITAALFVGGVENVILRHPIDDIDPGVDGAVIFSEITLDKEVVGG